MSLRRKLAGGAVLAFGKSGSQAMSLVRNLMVARMLGPEEFGIGATLAVLASLIEMTSDVALDRMLVQAPDGDSERLQANAQSLQLVRGVVGALGVLALAWPMALLLNTPQALPAYLWIALLPLLRGLMNLDFARQQRAMRFGATTWIDAGSQGLALALAWPLAHWLRDHTAVLVLILVQAGSAVALSHMLAARDYRLGWDRPEIRRFLAFGWPLLINGLLLWVIMQGDRLIVGSSYTLRELGWYSAAAMLTLVPSLSIAKSLRTFLLPVLAPLQADRERFNPRAAATMQVCVIAGAALAAVFVVGGAGIISLLYGEAFAPAGVVAAWLGAMQMFRLAKSGAAVVAMALGDTVNPMLANVWRLLGVGGALAAALGGAPIHVVAIAGLAGEIVAFIASVWMLARRRACPAAPALHTSGLAVLVLGALAWAGSALSTSDDITRAIAGCAASVVAPAILLALSRQARAMVRQVVQRAAQRAPRPAMPTPSEAAP